MEAIKVNNLSKSYVYYEKEKGVAGSIKNIFNRKTLCKDAVKNLNISIKQGEIVVFIGLNGAGKTTTLKMLSGVLKPTSGSAEVIGFNPFDKNAEFLKRITMVMGNKSQLWWDIPAVETFELNKEIYEVDDKTYNQLLNKLTDDLNVKHLLNIQVRRLSLGERMKMELISALIHSPSVMFLDEPTIGLDVLSQHNIREFLKEYNKNYNTTIILTSHNFDDIVYLCDRLLIIDKGEIICDSPFSAFLERYSNNKILTIKFNDDISNKFIKEFERYNTIRIIKQNVDELKISIHNDEVIKVTNDITKNYFNVLKDINIENLDITEVIKNIYA